MPLVDHEQEEHPDFEAHPFYQHMFQALLTQGQNREEAMLLMIDVWNRTTRNNAQPPDQPPQPPDNDNQPGQDGQDNQQQDDQDPPPFQEPDIPLPPRNFPARQGPPPVPNNHQEGPAPDKPERRALHLPPVDLNARSLTEDLERPTSYAIERLRKFEYVPLWYFTEQGLRAADKDKSYNEDLWDVTKTSDDRLSLRPTATNRPNPNALDDEQLSWEQFLDASNLLCRWLIPADWPEDYAKLLLSFFYRIQNHQERNILKGKETLLLYQARARKAWHEELKAGHFYNLAALSKEKMELYRNELAAKRYDATHRAVSKSNHIILNHN